MTGPARRTAGTGVGSATDDRAPQADDAPIILKADGSTDSLLRSGLATRAEFASERLHTDGTRHVWVEMGTATFQCRDCSFRTSLPR